MEPVDDVLIPPPAPEPNRLRTCHVLRALAFVLIAVAAVCGNEVYRADLLAPASQRTSDMMGVGLVFFFGILLWWLGGRKVGEMAQPIFRNASDAPTDVRIDRHNAFWVVASLLAGFLGLSSVTFGATLALRPQALMVAYPYLRQLNLSPKPILVIGGLLVVLSLAALALAVRRRAR
jgi:hypothetical protein